MEESIGPSVILLTAESTAGPFISRHKSNDVSACELQRLFREKREIWLADVVRNDKQTRHYFTETHNGQHL